MNPNLKKQLIGEFSFKRLVRSFFIIVVLLYALVMVFALSFADKLIFQPQTSFYSDDDSIIKLETPNHEKISARYFKNEEAQLTILFSHGNAEDLGTSEDFLIQLKNAGYSVFSYDYRGYGTSDGAPSEENSYEDIETAYIYLTENLNIPPEKIILHGRSLGGAVAVDLAAKKKCGGLIVESSFVSAFRVMTGYKLLPFDKFNNLAKIKQVRCPVLFIHGQQDELIRIWHTEKLYESANQAKYLFRVPQAGHNNVFQTSKNKYLQAIKDFSDKI